MAMKRKLIEVALPLEAINTAAAKEKTMRAGLPSGLHLWWARRPFATARAVIWASLVDDPSSYPDKFPTDEEQQRERERLFGILSRLVDWGNINDTELYGEAFQEILKSTDNNPPALLDPFAGGGAIPLEAKRLGLKSYAGDLNPVAVSINRSMIEIPAAFEGVTPVNPEWQGTLGSHHKGIMPGATGLAEDVRYYSRVINDEVQKRIGHLYSKVALPTAQGGGQANAIAWIWAHTVKCPNPACNSTVPLINSFYLSKKAGKEAYVVPVYNGSDVSFKVQYGKPHTPKDIERGTKNVNEKGKASKAVFCCPKCGSGIVNGEYVDTEAKHGRMGSVPVSIVAECKRGRYYADFSTSDANALAQAVQDYYEAHEIDEKVPHVPCRGTFASNAQGRSYGYYEFCDYFTKRQLIAISSFCDAAQEVRTQIEHDAEAAGMYNDHISLSEGGRGAKAYGEAVSVYLSFAIDKCINFWSSLCGWRADHEAIRETYSLHGISMSWDYAEANPFSNSVGNFLGMVDKMLPSIIALPTSQEESRAKQHDAQTDAGYRDIMVSTDPPYYDNIGYADLSDYFYVWMKQSLKTIYPKLFRTMLVPKAEELIATPYRFDGDSDKARDFFEDGMFNTCCQISKYTRDDIPVTIYYAFKQSETVTSESGNEKTASTGWETMLSAIIRAGFTITGTWPVKTEMSTRIVAIGTNALASSIVLVCRKRAETARSVTRREFINALHREMRPALEKLQSANIAPVDLAQSAIGPGIGVFSRFKSVLEADGKPMTVRSALQIINQELDSFYNEQEGELDRESRFCVDLFNQYAFNNIKFGDADILARAKNTSVQALADRGVLTAAKGQVRLLTRDEIPERVDATEECTWLLTQQLARAMEKGGVKECANIVVNLFGSNAENAKALAYRLYTICERKNWAQEGFAYNNLVVAWPDIQAMAAAIQAETPVQLTFEF